MKILKIERGSGYFWASKTEEWRKIDEIGEYPVFCVFVIWFMLPERSKNDDDIERTIG